MHVADLSNPHVEDQIRSVNDILGQMDLEQKPRLLVFNKCDLADAEFEEEMVRRFDALAVSALKGDGLDGLSMRLKELVFGKNRYPESWVDPEDTQPITATD